MLRKLDDLLFKGLHLGLLGFLLYGGLTYAPESPATLLMGFVVIIAMLWVMANILFKISDFRTIRKIDKYYR